ncbi:MAG: protein phosphatase 2C domain-containing protein [Anaerolineales bacterium]|nr:protein phosphatase 2C domain-containing protein [Anaerolineales bacterium]
MIPSNENHLLTAAITDPGSRGRLNEDSYQITSFTISDDDDTPVLLTVVADGIGGHKAGEIASKITVETITSAIAESDVGDPQWVLKSALLEANHSITSEAADDDERIGMGSTVACALVIDASLYIATLGDSRIYLIRDNIIRQLTVDHTWVQEALDVGVINSEEARNHPRRHLIRSYLGSSDPISPDLRLYLADNENLEQAKANQGLPLLPKDQILLCTDGLSDLVADEEILDFLQGDGTHNEQLQKMVDLANLRGGHDNITVVLLQPPGEELFEEPLTETE